jgi:hypothetical protein
VKMNEDKLNLILLCAQIAAFAGIFVYAIGQLIAEENHKRYQRWFMGNQLAEQKMHRKFHEDNWRDLMRTQLKLVPEIGEENVNKIRAV